MLRLLLTPAAFFIWIFFIARIFNEELYASRSLCLLVVGKGSKKKSAEWECLPSRKKINNFPPHFWRVKKIEHIFASLLFYDDDYYTFYIDCEHFVASFVSQRREFSIIFEILINSMFKGEKLINQIADLKI